MKIYRVQLQFGIWLAASLPLVSHAAMELPYWLSPDWIAAKMSGFQVRNAERSEQTQKQEFSKNSENLNPATSNSGNSVNSASNSIVQPVQPTSDHPSRKPKLAPVEFATPKINEKYLSKEELYELRMQLKQKP